MNLFTNKRREEDRATITLLETELAKARGDLGRASCALATEKLAHAETLASNERMASQLEARRAKDPVRGTDGRFVGRGA